MTLPKRPTELSDDVIVDADDTLIKWLDYERACRALLVEACNKYIQARNPVTGKMFIYRALKTIKESEKP